MVAVRFPESPVSGLTIFFGFFFFLHPHTLGLERVAFLTLSFWWKTARGLRARGFVPNIGAMIFFHSPDIASLLTLFSGCPPFWKDGPLQIRGSSSMTALLPIRVLFPPFPGNNLRYLWSVLPYFQVEARAVPFSSLSSFPQDPFSSIFSVK